MWRGKCCAQVQWTFILAANFLDIVWTSTTRGQRTMTETHAPILATSSAIGAQGKSSVPTHLLLDAIIVEVSVYQNQANFAGRHVQLHAKKDTFSFQEKLIQWAAKSQVTASGAINGLKQPAWMANLNAQVQSRIIARNLITARHNMMGFGVWMGFGQHALPFVP